MSLITLNYQLMSQLLSSAATLQDNQLAEAINTPDADSCTLYIISKDTLYLALDHPVTHNLYRLHGLGQEPHQMHRAKFIAYLGSRGIFNPNTATAEVSTLALKVQPTTENIEHLVELGQILKTGGTLIEPLKEQIKTQLAGKTPIPLPQQVVIYDPFQL